MTMRLWNQALNSVTRTLAVNACQLEYESTPGLIEANFEATNSHFCADRLERLLNDIVTLLQAEVLGQSSTHYEPEGASATVLIGQGDATLFHLDKSHLAVHTYFEASEQSSWGSFRCELELSTCGNLPVKELLERISQEFDFDVLLLDCKIRGFNRNEKGLLELAMPSSPPVSVPGSKPMSELVSDPRSVAWVECRQVEGFTVVDEIISESDCQVTLMADGLDKLRKSEWSRLLSVSPGES
jgi:S-adenosylmethionine/arginine decarboxylase-like enzyme